MKKIIIVGGGAAGIFSALLLSEKHKDVSIEIIEKEIKIGKKLRATGNGHANILNDNLDKASYSNQNGVFSDILSSFKIDELLEQYKKWGVPTTKIGNLYYPASYSAPSFVNRLEKLLADNKVTIKLGVSLIDYHSEGDSVVVDTSAGSEVCDELVLTTGGASSPKLGSDGSIFDILKKKGYSISELCPGLTPIRTKERIIKPLVGLRHKGLVSLTDGYGPSLYSENGEILYKKDGLSGICIMNISSKINWMGLRRPLIHVDLFPNENLSKFVSDTIKNEAVLEDSLYSEVLYQSKARGISFDKALHDLVYSYVGSYSFEDSQVTIGGVEETSVDKTLSSIIEKNVHFAGEILDFDGLCGGFNLAWALISAIVISRSL